MRCVFLGTYTDKPRIQALLAGCEALGIEAWIVQDASAGLPDPHRYAFAVTNGMHGQENIARNQLASHGIPCLVADCGYIHRAVRGDLHGYHQLGIGRIGWIPRRRPEDIGRQAWAARLAALEIDIRPASRRRRGKLLILGQVPTDSQHPFSDSRGIQSWIARLAAREVLRDPGFAWKGILWRPHPETRKGFEWITPIPGWTGRVETDENHCRTLEQTLDAEPNIAGAITYNSTSGVECVRRGLPVWCDVSAHYAGAPGAPGAPVSVRRDYFERLAWAQWTREELASGEALRFILARAEISIVQPDAGGLTVCA